MPIYEYECSSCSIRFERIQKISEPPITKCPECNGNSVKKLISATAFRLKGGGWYETDFKSSKEIKRNLVSSDEPNKTAASTQPVMESTSTTGSSKSSETTGTT